MHHRYNSLIAAFSIGAIVCVTGLADGDDLNPIPDGSRPCALLRAFPLKAEDYGPEAAKLIADGIPEKYGHEEWAAIVMAHEFHQHVGIYTLIGAKMAVLARETLNAPMRAVHATVETGKQQPFSCMVDGIQAGLASTLGQNLIEVPETGEPKLAAKFEFNGRSIRVGLKAEYADRIKAIIAGAIQKHGNLTPGYFEAVEQASYAVWSDFDRTTIFEVSDVKP